MSLCAQNEEAMCLRNDFVAVENELGFCCHILCCCLACDELRVGSCGVASRSKTVAPLRTTNYFLSVTCAAEVALLSQVIDGRATVELRRFCSLLVVASFVVLQGSTVFWGVDKNEVCMMLVDIHATKPLLLSQVLYTSSGLVFA